MSDKKEAEKGGVSVADFSNPVCQDTFESLPKIYGTIKNKVMTNKINFYQNIKRKQRSNLMKSFNKVDIIEQTVKLPSPGTKQKSNNKSKMQKKPLIKIEEIDNSKIARFEDKYHKFDLKPNQKHSRIVTASEAEDSQSKHKIKFNTIKFLPLLHHPDSRTDANSIKDHVSKSISINTPLNNLYRQDKKFKTKNELSEQSLIESESPEGIGKRNNYSKNRKQFNIKERMKTQQYSSNDQNMEIRRSSLKTQFSRRLYDEKQVNNQLSAKDNKFHIPKRQEYKNFIQSYHPLNPAFNMKKLIKQEKFQIISYQDGVYFGISELGIKIREGVLVTETSVFEGTFENDEKVKGFEQNIDGKYFGSFKNGLREGKGRYEWANGEFFEGDWKEGKKNGYGIWQSPNGDGYVGYWLNGRQHGTGTHTHKNSVYKGQFQNSLKHGHGEQSFANGDKFKGNYVHGKPEGKGKYEWTDGSYYEGEFKNGYRDGQGLLKEVDDSVYKVKAPLEEILSTVWDNNNIVQGRNLKSNTMKVFQSRKKLQTAFDQRSYLDNFVFFSQYFVVNHSSREGIKEYKPFEFVVLDISGIVFVKFLEEWFHSRFPDWKLQLLEHEVQLIG